MEIIIGSSNLLTNKNILNQNQMIKNNNTLKNITQNKPTPEEKEKERIELISRQLKGSKITEEKIQAGIFENVIGIRFQSRNLDRNSVLSLLR